MTEPAIVEAGTQQQPPKREPTLKSITKIEAVVNEYARQMAKKWKTGLKDDEFVILLSGRFKGIMGMQRGHPVKITFSWPDAQPHLNTLLSNAFDTIRTHKMVDVWAIEGIVHIRARNLENKKWRREKFGDLGEIIGELVPRKNIGVEVTTVSQVTTTIRVGDSVSLEKTETITKTDKGDGRGLDMRTWLEISRMVRDAEGTDDTESDSSVEAASQA